MNERRSEQWWRAWRQEIDRIKAALGNSESPESNALWLLMCDSPKFRERLQRQLGRFRKGALPPGTKEHVEFAAKMYEESAKRRGQNPPGARKLYQLVSNLIGISANQVKNALYPSKRRRR